MPLIAWSSGLESSNRSIGALRSYSSSVVLESRYGYADFWFEVPVNGDVTFLELLILLSIYALFPLLPDFARVWFECKRAGMEWYIESVTSFMWPNEHTFYSRNVWTYEWPGLSLQLKLQDSKHLSIKSQLDLDWDYRKILFRLLPTLLL